jgi:hypothetical protein
MGPTIEQDNFLQQTLQYVRRRGRAEAPPEAPPAWTDSPLAGAAAAAPPDHEGVTDRLKETVAALREYAARPEADHALVGRLTEKLKTAQAHLAADELDAAEALCVEVQNELHAAGGEKGRLAKFGEKTAELAGKAGGLAAKAVPKIVKTPVNKVADYARDKRQALTTAEKKKLAEETQHDLERRQRELVGLSIGLHLDPHLQALVAEHRAAVRDEIKAFEGVELPEDLLRIADPQEREERVKRIRKAVADAHDRRNEFANALSNTAGPSAPPPAWLEAMEKARDFQDTMIAHIPDAFLDLDRVEARLKRLEEAAAMSEDDRRDAREKLLREAKESKEANKKLFESKVNPYLGAAADRVDLYLDGVAVAPEGRELQELAVQVYAPMIERAYQIKDLGGSWDEVEKSLEAIPWDMRPPALVRELEAWRVSERRATAKAVLDLAKKKDKDKTLTDLSLTDTATGVFNLLDFANSLEGVVSGDFTFLQQMQQYATTNLGDASKLIAEAADDVTPGASTQKQGTAARTQVESGLAALGSMVSLVKLLGPYSKAIEDGKLAEELKKQMDHQQMMKLVATLTGMAASLKALPEVSAGLASATSAAGSHFDFAGIFPLLAVVGSGINLTLALEQLTDAVGDNLEAGRALKEIERSFYSGAEDDRALLNAVIREKHDQNIRTARHGVDTANKGIAFGADATAATVMVAETVATGSGFSAPGVLSVPLSAGFKVVKGMITYGGQVVFAAVDWNEVKRSKKTLKAARGGSYAARTQLFEDSARYARIYLIELACRNHPFAKQFLIDRQIAEKDINPGNAMEVLNQLLKGAEVKDETKYDSFTDVLGEAMLSKESMQLLRSAKNTAAGAGRAVAGGAVWTAKKVYGWSPPAPKGLDADAVRAVLAEARDKGGMDDDGGLAALLPDLEVLTARGGVVLGALDAFQAAEAGTGDKKQADNAINEGRAALLKFKLQLLRCNPSSGGKPHTRMIKYVARLADEVDKQLDGIDNLHAGVGREKWVPPDAGRAAASWEDNWADAAEKLGPAGFPAGDGGAGKTLSALEGWVKFADLNNDDPRKARKAWKNLLKWGDKALEGLERCYEAGDVFPEVREYVRGWMLWVNEQRQHAQAALHNDRLGEAAGLDVSREELDQKKQLPEAERRQAFQVLQKDQAAEWSAASRQATRRGMLKDSRLNKRLGKELQAVERKDAALADAERRRQELAQMRPAAEFLQPLSDKDKRRLDRQEKKLNREAAKARNEAVDAQVRVAKTSDHILLANGQRAVRDSDRTHMPRQTEQRLQAIGETAKARAGEERAALENVPFEANPDLTRTAFRGTFRNAADNGAVPPGGKLSSAPVRTARRTGQRLPLVHVPAEDKARRDVSKRLAKFEARQASYDAAEAGKDKLEAARKLERALKKLGAAVEGALRAPGFRNNKPMTKYLEGLRDSVKQRLDDKAFKDVLTGTAVGADVRFTSKFKWDDPKWHEVKKEAVRRGILPDETTHMDAALNNAHAAVAKWQKANKKQKEKARYKARLRLAELTAAVGALKISCAHPALVAYLDAVLDEVTKKTDELADEAAKG